MFSTVFQLGVAMRSNPIRTVNSNLASVLLVSVFALNGNACCFAQEEAGSQELGQGQSTSQEADTRSSDATQEEGIDKETDAILKVGDAAPRLVIDHWINGKPVEEFSKDKFYVIEFWATWCGPCIKSMPHLNELAKQHAENGLEVIALTTADSANTLKAVQKFVEGHGKDFDFRYAFCETREMSESYMTAAGQQGIPCSFVIDQQGKIAYIGRPADLDYVLSRVARKQWNGRADAEELSRMNASIANLRKLVNDDPEKAAAVVAHVQRVNPKRAAALDFVSAHVHVLCKLRKFEEARKVVEDSLTRCRKNNSLGEFSTIVAFLGSKELDPEGVNREFALKTLDMIHSEVKEDQTGLAMVGLAYRIAGETEKCVACFKAAIAITSDESMKAMLQKQVELLQAGQPKPQSKAKEELQNPSKK
ncbi:MAG TPA: hypothetical protein DDW52_02640 [Planctomycetaceae bacterium]|nr:hypothetical protein [Planctomycetaceae bacterium]